MAKCNAGRGCRIECPAGCGAVYVSPKGPCITWCEPNSPNLNFLKDDPTFSVDLHDLSTKSLQSLLEAYGSRESQELAAQSDRKISATLEATNVQGLIREIERQLR